MTDSLKTLIDSGTKLWLDSIDPDLVTSNREAGATGATSNPIIVSDLIKSGRFDGQLEELAGQGMDDSAIAWQMTDTLVKNAQAVFLPVWEETKGNDGYVSFEVDPLLEDGELNMPHEARVANYISLGTQWAEGHQNRMIKVPATPAGIEALEEMVARGLTINLTLIFTMEQYRQGREAIWRGAQRRSSLEGFKSVYSIFVSRLDVFTDQKYPQLSDAAQGQVGILNAKRIWAENQEYWSDKGLDLEQEIIFASTGTKKPEDSPWKYIDALAGSDIQTNPPKTNEAIAESGHQFAGNLDKEIDAAVASEIDSVVDFDLLYETLISEGLAKFADPQKGLLATIAEKRAALSAT